MDSTIYWIRFYIHRNISGSIMSDYDETPRELVVSIDHSLQKDSPEWIKLDKWELQDRIFKIINDSYDGKRLVDYSSFNSYGQIFEDIHTLLKKV